MAERRPRERVLRPGASRRRRTGAPAAPAVVVGARRTQPRSRTSPHCPAAQTRPDPMPAARACAGPRSGRGRRARRHTVWRRRWGSLRLLRTTAVEPRHRLKLKSVVGTGYSSASASGSTLDSGLAPRECGRGVVDRGLWPSNTSSPPCAPSRAACRHGSHPLMPPRCTAPSKPPTARPIGDFVPLLVEHGARDTLTQLAEIHATSKS